MASFDVSCVMWSRVSPGLPIRYTVPSSLLNQLHLVARECTLHRCSMGLAHWPPPRSTACHAAMWTVSAYPILFQEMSGADRFCDFFEQKTAFKFDKFIVEFVLPAPTTHRDFWARLAYIQNAFDQNRPIHIESRRDLLYPPIQTAPLTYIVIDIYTLPGW